VPRFLPSLAKVAASVGLLAYLLIEVQRSDPETFTRLQQTAPRWTTLVLAWGCLFASLAGGIVRWQIVLLALGVPSRIGQVFRYAAYSYALDFAALGTAGGDVAKAILLTREHPGQGALVLSSVVIDRIIGLYCLLTIAALVVLASGEMNPDLYPLRLGLIIAALSANLLVGLLWFAPGLGNVIERRRAVFGRHGEPIVGVVVALRRIRDRPLSLVPAVLLSAGVLVFLVTGFFLIGVALRGAAPTYAEQWQIVPIAMLSAIIPLPGGTLGALDYAMSFLYQHVTAGRVALGQGLLVVMVSRVVSIILVSTAAALYLVEGKRHESR